MAYRDSLDALEAREEALKRDLEAAQERARELHDVRRAEGDAIRELEEVRKRIAQLRGPKRLRVLEDIRIASPCDADWDAMKGDDKVRFCASCQKNVYNLSAMPRAEAERLVEEKEGRLCVQIYRRADGTVLTEDCPVGVARKRRRRRLFGAAAAVAFAGGALTAGWRMTSGKAPIRCQIAVLEDVTEEKDVRLTKGDVAPTREQGEVPARPVRGEIAPPLKGRPMR